MPNVLYVQAQSSNSCTKYSRIASATSYKTKAQEAAVDAKAIGANNCSSAKLWPVWSTLRYTCRSHFSILHFQIWTPLQACMFAWCTLLSWTSCASWHNDTVFCLTVKALTVAAESAVQFVDQQLHVNKRRSLQMLRPCRNWSGKHSNTIRNCSGPAMQFVRSTSWSTTALSAGLNFFVVVMTQFLS